MVDSCGSSPDASDTLDASKDFVALDPSADAWDDTALISAFDRVVASYKRPGEKRKKRVEQPTEVADTDMAPPPPQLPFPPPSRQAHTRQRRDTGTAQGTSKSVMLPPPPPPPPGTDAKLRDLLSAWYEAGFRAGLYYAAQDKQG